MTVVALRQEAPCGEISATLRRIADQIDGGDIEWPISTAVLVLAHREERPDGDEQTIERTYWRTYGMGPRRDSFTCKGVLAEVIHKGFDKDD